MLRLLEKDKKLLKSSKNFINSYFSALIMRPTAKTRHIQSMKYQLFSRQPTLGDYCNVVEQIQGQNIIPDLNIRYLQLVTPDWTITDLLNFNGMSKTREYSRLPIVKGSKTEIYLENDDGSFAVDIEDNTCPPCLGKTMFSLFEFLAGLILTSYSISVSRDYLFPGLLFLADGVRNFRNEMKDQCIRIKAGTTEDITAPVFNVKKKVKVAANSLEQKRHELEEMVRDIGGKRVNYSDGEFDRFKEFVAYINRITV
jgi:hypothetical protein